MVFWSRVGRSPFCDFCGFCVKKLSEEGGEEDEEDHKDGEEHEDDLQPLVGLATEFDGLETLALEARGVVIVMMVVALTILRHRSEE